MNVADGGCGLGCAVFSVALFFFFILAPPIFLGYFVWLRIRDGKWPDKEWLR